MTKIKKILTAIGNPFLNNELKKYGELIVINNDVQYQDGIFENVENEDGSVTVYLPGYDFTYTISSQEINASTEYSTGDMDFRAIEIALEHYYERHEFGEAILVDGKEYVYTKMTDDSGSLSDVTDALGGKSTYFEDRPIDSSEFSSIFKNNDLLTISFKDDEDVELFCCIACGDSGCWSVCCKLHEEGDLITMTDFHHNGRDLTYPFAFRFTKENVCAELKKLEGLT